MQFKDFVRMMTDISDTGTGNLLNSFYDNFSEAVEQYRLNHSLDSVASPPSGLNMSDFYDQETFDKYRKFLYISCKYWIDNWAQFLNINRIQNVFEAKGIPFIGDNVRVNFYQLLEKIFLEDYDVNDGEISRNEVLDAEDIMTTKSIPNRITYPENTLFYDEFEQVQIDEIEMYIPYKEIYGIQQGKGLDEDENIIMKYLPCADFDQSDLECKGCVQKQNIKDYILNIRGFCTETKFWEKVEEKRQEALAKRGYDTHPAKLKIVRFQKPEKNSSKLELEFGCSGYLEHLVYQDVLKEKEIAQNDFREDIHKLPDNDAFNQRDTVWSRAGGGVWLVTEDNYLIVSYRGKTVHEVPGVISYSSSGGFDRKVWNRQENIYEDGTPAKNMKREILQELNIDAEKKEVSKLEIVSFGVDLLGGPWMQFSFLANTSLTMKEVLERNLGAIDRHEFKIFFIPFTADAVKALLLKANMEAGADYSLYEIYKMKLAGNAD